MQEQTRIKSGLIAGCATLGAFTYMECIYTKFDSNSTSYSPAHDAD